MAHPRITIRERIAGALRMLLGRGDDALACSFCGRSAASGETIVAGPAVAICAPCAYVALDAVASRGDDPPHPSLSEISVMPLLEPVCLLPARRATLAADLADAAAGASCRLLGWSYACNSRIGDQMAVRLGHEDEVTGEQVSAQFIARFIRP